MNHLCSAKWCLGTVKLLSYLDGSSNRHGGTIIIQLCSSPLGKLHQWGTQWRQGQDGDTTTCERLIISEDDHNWMVTMVPLHYYTLLLDYMAPHGTPTKRDGTTIIDPEHCKARHLSSVHSSHGSDTNLVRGHDHWGSWCCIFGNAVPSWWFSLGITLDRC